MEKCDDPVGAAPQAQDQPLQASEGVKETTAPEAQEPTVAAPSADAEQGATTTETQAAETQAVETQTVEPQSADLAPAEPERPRHTLPDTIEGVIDALQALADGAAAEISRDVVSRLRLHASTLRSRHEEELRAAWVAEGNAPEAFIAPEDDTESCITALIEAIRVKKNEYLAQQEAIRLANLERKNDIIEKINALADDTDNVGRNFPAYRELQDAFNAIGDVPPTDETAVWKRYQEARERYSDNLKINKELRDYDFKKNLESKELLIKEAEALADEPDIIVAFKRVQSLHSKWREIGPVAKDLREEIWGKFKEACAVVNKRYQAFFEERKAREAENEAGKTALCERIEALDFEALKTFPAWEDMTKQILAAQEEWKKLGYASRKANNALFNRFRATCDKFFEAKAAFFRKVKEEMAANLARKMALADEAEALSTSTDWRKTTDRLVEMQKEWKTIGSVPKKQSDTVWTRFQKACDAFFANKKAGTRGTRQTELANLQAKRDLIKRLDEISAETPKDEARKLIFDLQEQWKSIGHVPFKEKDAVYDAFRKRIDEVRRQFDLRRSAESMERFNSNLSEIAGDKDRLGRERERMARALEARRQELRTYANNLGFLSSKSKSGDSLVRDIEAKMRRLEADIADIEQRMRLVDEKLS